MATDTVSFDDGSHYTTKGGEGISYRELVLAHLKKVSESSFCEFRGGYFTIIKSKEGEREVYIPDTREIYCNAVYSIALFIQPRFNKNMKHKFKLFKMKMKKLETEFMKNSSPDETIILNESFYPEERDKIMLEELKNKKRLLHTQLLAILIKHLEHPLKWLEAQALED